MKTDQVNVDAPKSTKYTINKNYKFLYLTLAKIIGIALLLYIGTYTLTAGFYGDIMLAFFIYLTSGIFTFNTIQSIFTFIKNY